MKGPSSAFPYLVGGALVLALLLGIGMPFLIERRKARDRHELWEEAIRKLMGRWEPEKGFWVGDVAEMHRMGWILREVAEADTAPLHPLVGKPVPFHGYFVRSLDGGQPTTVKEEDAPPSFHGETWSTDTFGFCIYPAEGSPHSYTWLVGRLGLYRREGGGAPPLKWPTRKEIQMGWAIVD